MFQTLHAIQNTADTNLGCRIIDNAGLLHCRGTCFDSSQNAFHGWNLWLGEAGDITSWIHENTNIVQT